MNSKDKALGKMTSHTVMSKLSPNRRYQSPAEWAKNRKK